MELARAADRRVQPRRPRLAARADRRRLRVRLVPKPRPVGGRLPRTRRAHGVPAASSGRRSRRSSWSRGSSSTEGGTWWCRITVRAQGRNGIEVSAETNTHVFTARADGRVARVAMYQELEEALAAADPPAEATRDRLARPVRPSRAITAGRSARGGTSKKVRSTVCCGRRRRRPTTRSEPDSTTSKLSVIVRNPRSNRT